MCSWGILQIKSPCEQQLTVQNGHSGTNNPFPGFWPQIFLGEVTRMCPLLTCFKGFKDCFMLFDFYGFEKGSRTFKHQSNLKDILSWFLFKSIQEWNQENEMRSELLTIFHYRFKFWCAPSCSFLILKLSSNTLFYISSHVLQWESSHPDTWRQKKITTISGQS